MIPMSWNKDVQPFPHDQTRTAHTQLLMSNTHSNMPERHFIIRCKTDVIIQKQPESDVEEKYRRSINDEDLSVSEIILSSSSQIYISVYDDKGPFWIDEQKENLSVLHIFYISIFSNAAMLWM